MSAEWVLLALLAALVARLAVVRLSAAQSSALRDDDKVPLLPR